MADSQDVWFPVQPGLVGGLNAPMQQGAVQNLKVTPPKVGDLVKIRVQDWGAHVISSPDERSGDGDFIVVAQVVKVKQASITVTQIDPAPEVAPEAAPTPAEPSA